MFIDRGHLLEVVTETPLQFLARAIGLGYIGFEQSMQGQNIEALPK